MRGQALVSILIVNWNGRRFLKDCLPSLRNQTYKNHEIILVDNGSIDGSVHFVRENFPEVKVVENEVNIGPAAARNLGFQKSAGEYIAFLDNDTELDPDWLAELVNAIESDKTIGAVQSKILSADERDQIWATGESLNYFGEALRKAADEKDNGQHTSKEEIFNAISAAMIIRRRVFEEIGMFDPAFFIMLEDVDLGWRIWLGGHRVIFAPKSVVYHRVHGSGSRDFTARKNLIAMMIKNYSFKNLIKYVSARIIIDIGTTIRLIIRRKNRGLAHIALMKGIVWNLKNLRYIWKEHLRVQHSLRRVSDEYIMERIMTKPAVPYVLIPLNLFPFGGRVLRLYERN